jgi:hypothetical protein
MVLQAGDIDAKLKALHLDAQEREEAEYHIVLSNIVRPVEDAVAAFHAAAPAGRCAEWAAEHRDSLVQVAARLRETHPPEWLAVYRDSFLGAIELFLQAADCWCRADTAKADDCAEQAEGAWDDAEELADGLI